MKGLEIDMKKKKVISAVLTAALCFSAAWPAAVSADSADTVKPIDGTVSGEGVPTEETVIHAQYLNGFEDATIRPENQVTRAQAAQMLSGVSAKTDEGKQTSEISFSDVKADAWYYDAVMELAEEGILKGYQDGTFRPDRKITRAEFAAVLKAYNDSGNSAENRGNDRSAAASFSDVSENSWYYEAVSEAAAKGWITGYTGGRFKPESNATRAESVTMINRLLGRSADKMTINMATDIRIMPDVTDSHWAYYQLLEALTEHTCTVSAQEERWTSHQPGTVDLAQGWHNIGGELFHVSSSGCFDYNKEVEGLSLDSCGRYTTGDAELDALLTAAVKEALRPGMTQEERLRAVYDYAKETFSYRGAENVETGSTGWELGVAKTMLTDRKGNCYSWAAAFTYLSRKVGYPSNAIAGESISEKGNRSIHAWTEIEFDGTPYTFDPQIEAVYAANYGINYDLYKKAYGTTPITYVKPEIQEPEEPETPEPDSKLSDILDIVYDGVESPNTAKIALNSENEKYYLGVEGLDYRAGIGSDALVIAIPHSVVLIEMNEGADIEAAKKSIKENADGRKWICVGVSDEDIRVESAGNYILLVMADNSEEYIANFSAHAEEIAAM